jgi:glycosyltransferase involved in cell wall biosynthesis
VTRLLYNVNIPRFFVSHRLRLALEAQKAGYEVHVTTSDQDTEQIAQILAAGLAYHPLPLRQHGTSPLDEARTLRAMVRLYRTLKPDIVHQVSIKPVLYGGIASQLAGVRARVSAMSGLGYVFIDDRLKARGVRALAVPFFKMVLAPQNVRVIFQNPEDLERFVAMGAVTREKARLIRGSGVDVTQFVPRAEAAGPPTVLFAGRLMWRKGIGDFAEMARRLRHRARFVVAGYVEATSPDAVSRGQLDDWQREGILEWLGKRDDMPEVLAAAHVVCLPSTYGEGVPKILIEAAACGRAIVATDAAGCREIVRHDVNGLLIPPGDTGALVGAVTRLLDDAELRQAFGRRGRDIAVTGFSLDRVVRETLAVYEELLKR